MSCQVDSKIKEGLILTPLISLTAALYRVLEIKAVKEDVEKKDVMFHRTAVDAR